MSKKDNDKGPRKGTSLQASPPVACLRGDDVGAEKKKVTGWDTLRSFCETTTFHGLRNVVEPDYNGARR